MTFLRDFWARLVAIFRWIGLNLLAPVVAALVLIGGVMLMAMGAKELQIGGLLNRLLGKVTPEKKAIDVANSVPSSRVNEQGQIIPIGQADNRGYTQAVVVPVQEPGLLSDPTVVKVLPPEQSEPIEIELPKGVTSKDVHQVIQVTPETFVVTVTDASGIPASKIDDLLAKYGG